MACVDEGGPGKAPLLAILRDGFLEPPADALHLPFPTSLDPFLGLRADHKETLASGVAAQHLDGVCDGLVLPPTLHFYNPLNDRL